MYVETHVSGYGLWPSFTLTPGMVLDGIHSLNGSRERAEFSLCPDNTIVMRGCSVREDINLEPRLGSHILEVRLPQKRKYGKTYRKYALPPTDFEQRTSCKGKHSSARISRIRIYLIYLHVLNSRGLQSGMGESE
jgi:hypothetical protein